jgi:hypothetical protein
MMRHTEYQMQSPSENPRLAARYAERASGQNEDLDHHLRPFRLQAKVPGGNYFHPVSMILDVHA